MILLYTNNPVGVVLDRDGQHASPATPIQVEHAVLGRVTGLKQGEPAKSTLQIVHYLGVERNALVLQKTYLSKFLVTQFFAHSPPPHRHIRWPLVSLLPTTRERPITRCLIGPAPGNTSFDELQNATK